MPKLSALLAVLCLLFNVVYGQNRATIKGKVVDSLNNSVLELATVAVINIKDTASSLISYTLSDKAGQFALHNLPAGIPLKVLITFVSYKPFRKNFILVKGQELDLGTVALNSKQLAAVTITGEILPIVIRQDTIEFNAEAFKTRPNAVVEELLRKLPGVEVDNEGTITVNGKKVTKIMIDGKEFFANDPKIASKNLDASLIDKVQVYDDRENDPDHIIEDSKVNKIINLKFKNALKKSTFGKVYAGGGTQGRYESGALYNKFRDTLQISFIGVGNNLNKTGFSREDLYSSGGFNRAGDNVINNGTNFGGRSYGGIQNVATGGININNDYGKKLKLNFVYFLSYTKNIYSSKNDREQFLRDTTLYSVSKGDRNDSNTKHNISSYVKWNPDSVTQIKYNPLLTIGTSGSGYSSSTSNYSNYIPNISLNSGHNNVNGNNLEYQQSFSYYRRLKKRGSSFTISHNLDISSGVDNNYNFNQLQSFTAILPSSVLDRYGNTGNSNANISLSGNYRYPFTKKLTGDFTLTGDYTKRGNNLLTYDFNPLTGQYNTYIDSLSTNLVRYQWTEGIKTDFTYNFTKKASLRLGLTGQLLQIDNKFHKNLNDLNQNYINLLPSARLSIGSLSLSYDASISQPSISDLLPVRLVYSQLYSFLGNPDLKPARRNNFNFNYNSYKPETQINLNIYGGLTIEERSIYRQSTINSLAVQTSRPVNKDGQYNFYTSISFGKKFKKVQGFTFSTNTGSYFYDYRNFFQLNGDQGFQNTYYVNLSQRFTLNWNDKVEIDPSYSVSRSISNYTIVNYKGLTTTTHNADTYYLIHLDKKTDLEGNYTYTYNPLVSDGFQKSVHLLSLSLARQILAKERGEIKLSCYDILNQNISSSRSESQNAIYNLESQILKRYFLLTLRYKFNKVITK